MTNDELLSLIIKPEQSVFISFESMRFLEVKWREFKSWVLTQDTIEIFKMKHHEVEFKNNTLVMFISRNNPLYRDKMRGYLNVTVIDV